LVKSKGLGTRVNEFASAEQIRIAVQANESKRESAHCEYGSIVCNLRDAYMYGEVYRTCKSREESESHSVDVFPVRVTR
jgi:hypothetical protein